MKPLPTHSLFKETVMSSSINKVTSQNAVQRYFVLIPCAEAPFFDLRFYPSTTAAPAKWQDDLQPIGLLNQAINDMAPRVTGGADSNTPKMVEHYVGKSGEDDFIDETYKTETFADFCAAMFWTQKKYMRRFGKKDDLVKEAFKIKDYANRFYDKVVDHVKG